MKDNMIQGYAFSIQKVISKNLVHVNLNIELLQFLTEKKKEKNITKLPMPILFSQ